MVTENAARSGVNITALVRREVGAAVRESGGTVSPYFAHGRLQRELDRLRDRLAQVAQQRPDLLKVLAGDLRVPTTLECVLVEVETRAAALLDRRLGHDVTPLRRWSPESAGPAAERAWRPDAQQRLEAVGRILDESRDLLDVALERTTTVEYGLRRADQQTRDLQWDAAKILLDADPARPAMRTVHEVGDQLVTDLRRSRGQAEDLRDTLRQARRHLEHATPLVAELTGATQDAEHAAAAAMLATRLERLSTLVELATPLAERTSTRIEQGHRALEAGLMQTGDRSAEKFHQFWSLDRGIFDTAREHAVNASTLTAAHTRDRQRAARCSPTQSASYGNPAASARSGRPPGPAGPAI